MEPRQFGGRDGSNVEHFSGEVVEVNKDLEGDPALVNREAEGSAWFMKVKLSNPSELDALMDKAAYDKLVNG